MSPRAKFFLLTSLAVTAVLALALTLFLGGNQKTPQAPASSATATPALSQADQQALLQRSREFGEKFFSYRRPDDNSYLASLKPYLDARVFARVVSENSKASRFPNIPSVTSTVDRVFLEDSTSSIVHIAVDVTSKSGSRTYQQHADLRWTKESAGWLITSIFDDASSQTRERYSTDG